MPEVPVDSLLGGSFRRVLVIGGLYVSTAELIRAHFETHYIR